MKRTAGCLLFAGLLFFLAIPATRAEPSAPPDPSDAFAATLRAAAAIPKAKTRIYTLERVARAWARTDFCDAALQALQVEGDKVDAGAALEAASICAETVGGETSAKLLRFAEMRIQQTADPEQRALHLASLAGAYHSLERLEERNLAAQQAAAALPQTCDPLATVLARTALARRFAEVDMEAWAVHLLAGAIRVALDLPGATPTDDVWDADHTPQKDLTAGVMDHLRQLGEDATKFTPPPPLKGCAAAKTSAAASVAPEKIIALAAVSTALRTLGDADLAELARILAASFVRATKDSGARANATNEAAAVLAATGPPQDAVFFLSAVAEHAPKAVRRAFARMVFSGRLVSRNPTNLYVQNIASLATVPGPTTNNEERFLTALARTLVDLGAPEQAFDVAMKISEAELWEPVYMEVAIAIASVDPGRAIIGAGGMKGSWGAATLYSVATALHRRAPKEDVEEDIKEALEKAAKKFPKELTADRGSVEALLARQDAAPLTNPGHESGDDLKAARVLAITMADDSARNELLYNIARRYLRRGDGARAAGLARRITGRSRDRLLWSIGIHHLDAGRFVTALETLQTMNSDGRRVRALAEVALRLAKAGVHLDAAGAELLKKLAP